jgi:hypothetical protein
MHLKGLVSRHVLKAMLHQQLTTFFNACLVKLVAKLAQSVSIRVLCAIRTCKLTEMATVSPFLTPACQLSISILSTHAPHATKPVLHVSAAFESTALLAALLNTNSKKTTHASKCALPLNTTTYILPHANPAPTSTANSAHSATPKHAHLALKECWQVTVSHAPRHALAPLSSTMARVLIVHSFARRAIHQLSVRNALPAVTFCITTCVTTRAPS